MVYPLSGILLYRLSVYSFSGITLYPLYRYTLLVVNRYTIYTSILFKCCTVYTGKPFWWYNGTPKYLNKFTPLYILFIYTRMTVRLRYPEYPYRYIGMNGIFDTVNYACRFLKR